MDDSIWSKTNGMAAAALAEGRFEEARATYSELLSQVEKEYGAGDLRAASCHQALGEVYEGLGNMERAERHFQQGVAILEQQLGNSHPITLRVMTAFGAFYRRHKRFARAEPILRRAFQRWERLRSKSGLDVCETLDELSALYLEQGHIRDAERFKDKAELIRQQAKARDEEEMLRTMLTFAQQQIRKRNLGEAETLLREALAVTDGMRKPNHLKAAEILIELSQLTMTDLRFDEAVSHLERALNILCQSLGDHDATIADILRQLGNAYWVSGQAKQSVTCYEEALDVDKRIAGEQSEAVAADLHKLAVIYLSTNDLEQAERNALESLSLRETLHGERHPTIAALLKDLADIRHAQGRVEEAEELLQRLKSVLSEETSE